MLKANRKTLMITSAVILLPMLIGMFFWRQLPDVMATHFGVDNEANGFSSKAFSVFGIPVICLALHWFVAIGTSRDPKKQNISPKMFRLVLWLICGILMVILALCGVRKTGWILTAILAAVIVPFLYSFWLHEKRA
jgi:uncharacterized membrane protein